MHTEEFVRVYQAFNPFIAKKAIEAGRFVAPFKMDRMTWIKPSFNWMMYRSGYARKPQQEVVLAIDITRAGFDWALERAVLSSFEPSLYEKQAFWKEALGASRVRVQWDPERDWRIAPLTQMRAIQVGLSGEAVEKYVKEWIISVTDVTHLARLQEMAANAGVRPNELPEDEERPYPITPAIAAKIIPRQL